MKLPLYQIDAFTDQVFGGNPAAVCPLSEWPQDRVLQAIAAENNLSETAFFSGDAGEYRLRWFTPLAEVDLCGHATLATAYVIMHELEPHLTAVNFATRSGRLIVSKQSDGSYCMDFPAQPPRPVEAPPVLLQALSLAPQSVLLSEDWMAVYAQASSLYNLQVNMDLLKALPARGVIVTAPGDDCDIVSRFFAPKLGIEEDTVTGSAHCALIPYWADRLQKNRVHARQGAIATASRNVDFAETNNHFKRGGELWGELAGQRVLLRGCCVKYLQGELYL